MSPQRARTGRPWTYDEPATERIYLLATPAQRLELVQVARENGLTLSALIRDAATEYAAAHREKYPNGRPR